MILNTSIRLNKFISESGVCSRREADQYIEKGKVMINGRKARIGDQVTPRDKVMLNGQKVEPKSMEDFVFLAFNKPPGVTSTTEIGVKDSIIDYVAYHERIFPIGRLDKESQGLIFMTNNGHIVNKILRAGNNHEKEYLVTVTKPITDIFIEKMGQGVPILGEVTRKCRVTKESAFVFRIILVQGLNRQIRRMCEYFEYEVAKLERIRIMNITLKGIPLGEWREVQEKEMAVIFEAISDSSSTEEASTIHKNPKKATPSPKKSTPGPRKPKPAPKSIPVKSSGEITNTKSKELRDKGGAAKAKKFGPASYGRSYGNSGGKSKGHSSKR